VINQDNAITQRIINDLKIRYSDNIIAIYGIGSYFDDSLPSSWVINDLDIIVIVKILQKIPTQDWTDVPYNKKKINGYQVWIGFNTIKGYQNSESFKNESFSNYEWSLIELKHPENSKFLYGKDIRDQLPETKNLKFEYDDILARGLYHTNKSFSYKDLAVAKNEFSKAIFKTGFYLSIFLDPNFRKTSILEIGAVLKHFRKNRDFLDKMIKFFQEALIFRITGEFKSNFNKLREDFVLYIFSLLQNGSLHRKMEYNDIIEFLTNTFSGFSYLIKIYKKFRDYVKNFNSSNNTMNL
jgi:hypothetical protein